MTTSVGAVAFVVLLLFAIGFHEFGHFITAKRAGIKIRQFFIGFGPTLWSIRRGLPERVLVDPQGRVVDRHMLAEIVDTSELREIERAETEYGIKLLPIGGYVKVAGMSPLEEVTPEEYPRSFRAASTRNRAVVLAAGSVTHFITAFLVLMLIFTVIGVPATTQVVESVQETLPDGTRAPAAEAGIRSGDRIVAVDDERVRSWQEVRDKMRASAKVPVELTIEAASGGQRSVRLTPAAVEEQGTTIGVIGVLPGVRTERVDPVIGAARSAVEMGRLTKAFALDAPRAFTPEKLGLIPGRNPGTERPISIYGAGRFAAQAFAADVAIFLYLFVNLNVFVGLFNLLPLPPLDGGHLLLLVIERVRGRPVSTRTLTRAMAVGFVLLAVIGVSLLYQDIFSPMPNPFEQ